MEIEGGTQINEALRELFKDEIEEAIAESKMQDAIEIATKMLEAGYEPEMVASITEFPIEKVLEIAGLVVDNTMDYTRTSDFFTVRYVRADDPERLVRIEKPDRALAEIKERLGFGKLK